MREGTAGWMLVDFHDEVEAKVERLKQVDQMKGWPIGASVSRIARVEPRTKEARPYHVFVEVRADSREALYESFAFVEANFSHVDGYETLSP